MLTSAAVAKADHAVGTLRRRSLPDRRRERFTNQQRDASYHAQIVQSGTDRGRRDRRVASAATSLRTLRCLQYSPRMGGKRGDTLLNTMLFIEMFTLNRAWDRLTDDEFHWEPLPGSWGVRPASEIRTATPFITGDLAVDFDADLAAAADEGRAVEPLTTIAWLMWRVGSAPGRLAELDFLGGSHTADSGWTSPYIESSDLRDCGLGRRRDARRLALARPSAACRD